MRLKKRKLFITNWTMSQNQAEEYLQEYNNFSTQQGKINNIWHSIKTYNEDKEVEKYKPQ